MPCTGREQRGGSEAIRDRFAESTDNALFFAFLQGALSVKSLRVMQSFAPYNSTLGVQDSFRAYF
jgi:hypothetical protein